MTLARFPLPSFVRQGKLLAKKQTGFTLLELVISMSLTVLLLSTLSAGVYSVVNDWQRQTTVLDETLDKTLAALQIERALLAAFPHSFIDRDLLDRFVYFEGTATTLGWVSTVSPQRQTELTAWYLEADSATGLQLRLVPAYSDNPAQRLADTNSRPLLSNYTAEFRYLLQKGEDEKQWLDEWSGEQRQSLPIAVHITLFPINEARDQILEILAPIKAFKAQDIEPELPVLQ